MTGTISIPGNAEIFPATEQAETTELVRGNEQKLLARLSARVRLQNVTLNLERVERIDAAGISALLSLYASARAAGHLFTVINPAPHVAEILSLVGLRRVLLSRIVVTKSHPGARCDAPSARKHPSRLEIPA
jgi:anti-anti-sigma factor